MLVAFAVLLLAISSKVARAQNVEPAGDEPADAEQPAPTEGFKQWPVDEKLLSAQTEVNRMVRGGLVAGQEQRFDDFFRKYALPLWTVEKNFPSLPKLRQSLRNQLNWARTNSAYDRLNTLLLEELGKMANAAELHPAPRFNAIVMIGDLNVRPSATNQPAKPLPAALNVLLAAFEDEKQNDAVRMGAMLGIVRHATLGIDDEAAKRRAAADMLALATTPEVSGRTRDGHAWMRARAIGVLGQFKSPGQDGAVAKAMLAILDEPGAPFSVRAAAAQALGELDLTPQSGVGAVEAARALGRLARDACRDELEQCEKKKDRLLNARKLKSRLIPVRIGLTGTKDSVTDPTGGIAKLAIVPADKKAVVDIWKPIEIWIGKLDDKDLTPKPEPTPPGPGMPGFGLGGPMGGLMGGGPMGMPGAGGMPGMETAETPSQVASKRILAEIKTELEGFETLLEAGAK
ncbi:MAG: hypothetical protein JW809_01860 [Pirellulales bacterium]|nr:hypothetical protein [Pirellulales bacterium]